MYANLLGIPVLLFEENSTGEYLKAPWGIDNENLHSARGIKNSDKFMPRVKKALATSLENQR